MLHFLDGNVNLPIVSIHDFIWDHRNIWMTIPARPKKLNPFNIRRILALIP